MMQPTPGVAPPPPPMAVSAMDGRQQQVTTVAQPQPQQRMMMQPQAAPLLQGDGVWPPQPQVHTRHPQPKQCLQYPQHYVQQQAPPRVSALLVRRGSKGSRSLVRRYKMMQPTPRLAPPPPSMALPAKDRLQQQAAAVAQPKRQRIMMQPQAALMPQGTGVWPPQWQPQAQPQPQQYLQYPQHYEQQQLPPQQRQQQQAPLPQQTPTREVFI